MSEQVVRRWCRQFKAGRQHVHDEECSGRPSIITDDLVSLYGNVLWRIVASQLRNSAVFPADFPLLVAQNSHGAPVVQVGAKATDTRTQSKAHGVALTFLQQYHDDGDECLDRIITGDGTRVAHITPETKQQSMHWRHNVSPCNRLADFVGVESDVHGVLRQTGHSPLHLPD